MASVNKVIIVGNLGKDPETRSLPSGDQVCNFSVATTDKWKDKQTSEAKEATEWHRVGTFGKLADICAQYLRKGSQVYIEGSLHTRKWTDKDGVGKYSTEIKAETMKMLGAKPEGQPQRQEAPRQTQSRDEKNPSYAPPKAASGFDDFDSDIPF